MPCRVSFRRFLRFTRVMFCLTPTCERTNDRELCQLRDSCELRECTASDCNVIPSELCGFNLGCKEDRRLSHGRVAAHASPAPEHFEAADKLGPPCVQNFIMCLVTQ